MSTDGQGQSQQYLTPPPFVTHEQMGGVHSRLGALEQGHSSLVSMYGHYRGEMLGQFDLLRADIRKIAEVRQQEPREQGGLHLSVREAFIACFAIMAGTALITKMAVDPVGAPAMVRSAADLVP
jgi:hypothetical protein